MSDRPFEMPEEHPLLWLRDYIGVRFSSEEELDAFCEKVAREVAGLDDDARKIKALLLQVFGPNAREVPEK